MLALRFDAFGVERIRIMDETDKGGLERIYFEVSTSLSVLIRLIRFIRNPIDVALVKKQRSCSVQFRESCPHANLSRIVSINP